jgi:four helix bundle protein
MAFVAYDVSLQLIRELRGVHRLLVEYDADDADQIHRAASSVVRNLAEGAGRTGKDRKRFYRYADASAREVRGCLDLAAAWGLALDAPLATLDRLCGLTWGLVHKAEPE